MEQASLDYNYILTEGFDQCCNNQIVTKGYFRFTLAELMEKSPPSLIALAGGAPNPDLFPFKKATVAIEHGSAIEIGEELMKRALQYSASAGYPS